MGRTLPRVGLGVPVGQWIRGPLHPWAEELEATRMKAEGWFDAAGSGALVPAPARQGDSTPALWSILMFESWHRQAAAG